MLLKQSPSRNQRAKGFKVKHAVQISLLLAVCIWLVYQVNHSHGKNALEVSSAEKISGEVQHEYGVLELGRRGLHPRVEESPVDVLMEKEEESEEETDETKAEESKEERKGSGDEVDGNDQEDLIDEDDTEREEEEESEEQESEEKGNDLEDQVQNKDTRYSQEAREEQYKGDDASSAVKQNIQTIGSQLEIGSLRRVKEEEVDDAENVDSEKGDKATSEKGGNQFGSSIDTSVKPKSSSGSLYGTEMLLKLYYNSI